MNHWLRSSSKTSTFLFLGIAIALSVHCYRSGVLEIDSLGYAGTVALAETHDIVKAHEMVYASPLSAHLRGLDDQTAQALDMRNRAADPYLAASHFPDFAVKPLYVIALQLVHKMGSSVINSTRVVSAFFYLGIVVMLWTIGRSWLIILIAIFPEILILGDVSEPDAMSCFALLVGLWLVFLKGREVGVLALLLAIWIRPENLLLCCIVILVLVMQKRLDALKAVVLVALAVGSEVAINHYEYPGMNIFAHVLRAAPGNSVFAKYVMSLLQAAKDGLHSPIPLFVIVWLLSFHFVPEAYRLVMGVTLVFTVLRFGLFPAYEARYYALFFVTTSIALVLVIRDAANGEILKSH